ncbi:EamA family transporter [Myxococcaceae bacterium GXIMD 01537]
MSTPTATAPTAESTRAPARGLSGSDVAILAVVVIWGTNYTVVKEALSVIPPLAFMALRFGLAAAAMGVLLLAMEGWKPLPRATLWKLAGLGLVGNTVYQVCFVVGLSHTSVANSGLLTAVTPVLVAGIGALSGVERLTRPIVIGLVLAVVGMLLIVIVRGPEMTAETRFGDLLIVTGCACWALYTVGIRTVTGVSALRTTGMTMLIGAPGVVAMGLPSIARLDFASVGALAWSSVVYSALVPLVLAYVLWNRSVQVVGSNRTALYNSGLPVVAALTAWAVRGERPTAVQAVGAVLIIGGLLLSRRR